jgi:hypothetical protein
MYCALGRWTKVRGGYKHYLLNGAPKNKSLESYAATCLEYDGDD